MTRPRQRVKTCGTRPGRIACASPRLGRFLAGASLPALLLLAGCGGQLTSVSAIGNLIISPVTAAIDTNCVGCNSPGRSGVIAEQFSATIASAPAQVTWSLAGGDPVSGAGAITPEGQYTPPAYLTSDRAQVTVTASLVRNPSIRASTAITLTPGFLQPLTPENLALGAGAGATITGYIAEAGGATGIDFSLAATASGTGVGQGSLGAAVCTRTRSAYTFCTVRYTAPAVIAATASTYIVARIGSSGVMQAAAVLLNTNGISSNPAAHQRQQSGSILLGSSGGNNNDYDSTGNRISDCCGGTLGALIQNNSGTQYLLSCNHILARSDQAAVGEMIVQPGLIDNSCTPNGDGAGTSPVGILTAWLPLSSSATNADAAIAQVDSNAVNPSGAIQELGTLQPGGILAPAPPGISSSGGKGEMGELNMTVAKSGRTTGLTCAAIAAVNLTVKVDYFRNCAETESYLTKTFSGQLGIEGNQFSDAGDSGALVVDAANAEPVGLFFAGSIANSGLSESIATPAPEVLAQLGRQEGINFTFVGAADHPVSCLDYGASAVSAAQAAVLPLAQKESARQAVAQARMFINPTIGVLGVAQGKSSDRAGEAAVIFYIDRNLNVAVPQTVDGVRTQVIPTTPQAYAAGQSPQIPDAAVPMAGAVLNAAIAAQQQVAPTLMQQNPAYFGVGVGQSLDNPREASLVVYVDRARVPALLPPTVNGLRARYVIMDRLHVTRSYLQGPVRAASHCMAHPAASRFSPGVAALRRRLGLQP